MRERDTWCAARDGISTKAHNTNDIGILPKQPKKKHQNIGSKIIGGEND